MSAFSRNTVCQPLPSVDTATCSCGRSQSQHVAQHVALRAPHLASQHAAVPVKREGGHGGLQGRVSERAAGCAGAGVGTYGLWEIDRPRRQDHAATGPPAATGRCQCLHAQLRGQEGQGVRRAVGCGWARIPLLALTLRHQHQMKAPSLAGSPAAPPAPDVGASSRGTFAAAPRCPAAAQAAPVARALNWRLPDAGC